MGMKKNVGHIFGIPLDVYVRAIPCGHALWSRGIGDNSVCEVFMGDIESKLHAFWICSNAKGLWKLVDLYSSLKHLRVTHFLELCWQDFSCLSLILRYHFSLVI